MVAAHGGGDMRVILDKASNVQLGNKLVARYGENGREMTEFILVNLGRDSLDFTNVIGSFRAIRLSTGVRLVKFR
jgi:hypothetical protein